MTPSRVITEIATFTPEAALVAARAGADRIELCSGYSEGGISPSAASIQYVRRQIQIPIHVMIRPRIGDFIYTPAEKEIILEDIRFCKQTGVQGIVCGALLPDGTIDKDFTQQMVEVASPMSVTFHRAFDLCPDLPQALHTLIECGIHRVLTSGGKPNALEGMHVLEQLVQQASNRLIILPGGGIRPGNVAELIARTGVREIHLSAKTLRASKASYQPGVTLTAPPGEVSDRTWFECNPNDIVAMKEEIMRLGL
ncbi:MAG: copper homeostasis protein CutC [Bacteroidales bacterium]